MVWEPYKKRPFLRGGVKRLGTLANSGRYAQLLIGALLREKGFDVTKSYQLFFDRKAFAIGLKISETGFKVTRSHNGSGSSQGYSIRMTGFCNRFEISGRCEISGAYFKPATEMWVLKLKPEK
jgi:hypothetical protein